jgi:glycosyltransferase involved in cell wall biosynthesis
MEGKTLPGVLFIVQLPPPLHGASMMNRIIVESKIIGGQFRTATVNMHFAETVQQLGKFTFGKLWNTFRLAAEISRVTRKFKPDVVYFNLTPKGFAFYRDSLYVFILKLYRKKIILHLQSKGIRENVERNLLKRLFYRLVFANTRLICLSPKLSDDFDKVYKSTPFYIPNGIERQVSDQVPVIREDTRAPAIMYLSHLLISKGVLVLIDALEILHKKGHAFTARLIGPPAELTVEAVENILSSKGLADKVSVTGPKYAEDKFNEFRHADIFVFPTYYEVFGLVILEAMQFTLPVIASIEGAIPDIVEDGITGFLVEKQNPEQLADKLAVLLTDGDLRRRMGQEGHRKFLKNYTVDIFESRILSTIQSVLNEKQ